MDISVEQPSALERRMTVSIPEDRIATEVKSRLDELQKTVRIDGFRQGKVPPSVIKRRFGSRVRDEIVGEVLQSTFSEAMTKEEMRPAGQPTIDSVSSDPGSGLTYTAIFEVFPEFELAPVENLTLTRPQCDVNDDDIDQMVERLREQNKDWVAVDRGAQDEDQVKIDFKGTIDGEVFEGGAGEDFDLVLGTGMMIDGFEDGLHGKKAGDSADLALQFPDDYRNEDLAGKAVRFEIDVKSVSESILPELDEAFIDKFGVSGGDIEAFRVEIRTNMEKERDRALRQRFSNDVMEKITNANDFDVPSALIGSESERLRQQVAQELIMRGVNPAEAADEFEQSVRTRAENRVKLGLIMAEIIKKAELTANPDKVRETIEGMASSYEDPSAVVKWYYDNPEQLQQIEASCLEEEVVNWVAEQATVSDESVSFDALMNPVQTDDKVEASS
ncbi:MAG: trigger factor [Gammaproteobacteria bacterium]